MYFPSPKTIAGKPDFFRVIITNTENLMVDSVSLKSITTRAIDHFSINKYTETIGSPFSFSQPEQQYPYGSGLSLRCYSDDEINESFVSGGCIDFSTSIKEDNVNGDFVVFPNPATDKIIILQPKNNGASQFCVYNYSGKELTVPFTVDGEKFEVNLTSLMPGFYFIRLFDKNNYVVKTMKFSKS